MLPKEEIYMPPMSIKVIDHRNFGRKPIVGIHTIKNLLKYRVDREKEQFSFTNLECNNI
jgi:myoferlin